jgi:hypothetical protein
MAYQKTSCSQCGEIIVSGAGLFDKSPESDGLFGHLCSVCANDRREQERHKERIADQRSRHEEFEKSSKLRQEEDRERYEEERLERERIQEEQAELQAELLAESVYKTHNPGEYKCPKCLYITLRANASRCPTCHGDISSQYWNDVRASELAEAERRRVKAIADEELRKRLAPSIEAEDLRRKILEEKKAVAAEWKTAGQMAACDVGLFILAWLCYVAVPSGTSSNSIWTILRGILSGIGGLVFILLGLIGIIFVVISLFYALFNAIKRQSKIDSLELALKRNSGDFTGVLTTNDLQSLPEVASGHRYRPSDTSSIRQPKADSPQEAAEIIKVQSMRALGIKEHQMTSSILTELRVPPGDLEGFFDDLEDRYGFFVSPDDRASIRSVSDIIRIVQNREK